MKLTVPIYRNLECRCGNRHCASDGAAHGWIDETWPTVGGGTLRMTICPRCRRNPLEGGQDGQTEVLF